MKTEKKNIVLYVIGTLISHLGSMLYAFTIGLFVLKQTGSSANFAATITFTILPIIFLSPFAGVIADQFDRKKVVVIMDTLNGILFISLFFIIQNNTLTLPLIYVTTFLSSLFVTIFGITFTSSLPQLVSDSSLTSINSISTVITAASSFIAPIVGGLLYAFISIETIIFINGVSFFISALIEYSIDFTYNYRGKISDQKETVFKSIKTGVIYLKNTPKILNLIGIFIVFNLIFSIGVEVPLPYICITVLKMSPTQYGLINSFSPVGIILGAILINHMSKKIQLNKLIAITTLAFSSIILLISVPGFLKPYILTSLFIILYFAFIRFAFGMLLSMTDVPIISFIQKETDESFRGRILSIIISISKLVSPLALMLSGYFTERINPYLLPLGAGILGLILFSILNYRQSKMIKTIEISKAIS